ncbi:MAG: hypothetical protein ABIP68_06590 [Ferruginibacter sp.]
MTDQEKINLVDNLIKQLEVKVTSAEMPVMVGSLNKAQGINGFAVAAIGHPVFEFKDRYLIYLQSNDGKTTVAVPYYKNDFKNVIDFI